MDSKLDMIDNYLKNQYSKYIIDLIKEVKKQYKIYLKNEDNYSRLKLKIYDLSIEIKAEKVEGTLSSSVADEMKEDFWGLLL